MDQKDRFRVELAYRCSLVAMAGAIFNLFFSILLYLKAVT